MAENTKIEWTDHTFNPWIGCTKVSPGCANCYAATQDTFRKWTPEGWGKGKPRKRTKTWDEPVKWNAANLRKCDGCGMTGPLSDWEALWREQKNCCPDSRPRPMRVFCASLADWLDDEVPIEWLADLLALIHATRNLDWQLLTKRPGNWYGRLGEVLACQSATGSLNQSEEFFEWVESWLDCIDMPERGDIPQNVWIGTTVEDQERADERIPQLLAIPARVRFLSCEPLLGPVVLPEACNPANPGDRSACCNPDHCFQCGVDWVIAGGESGKDARPMHPDWARGLRDQCASAEVPLLFKQWGEWAPAATHAFGDFPRAAEHVFHDRVLDGLNFGTSMLRVGKHAAGRLLDGIEHNGFPA